MNDKMREYLNSKIMVNQIVTVSGLYKCNIGDIVNVTGIAQFMYRLDKNNNFLTMVDDSFFEKNPSGYLDVKIYRKDPLFGSIVNNRLMALLDKNIFVHGELLCKYERYGKFYYMIEPAGEVKVIL